jgi:hypothetical protein
MRRLLALALVAGLVACSDAPTAPVAADDLPGSTLVAAGSAAALSSSHAGSPIVEDAVYADGELFGTMALPDFPWYPQDVVLTELGRPAAES